MGPSEGKSLDIDTVSKNRLNATKNHEIWHKFYKNGSRVLEDTPETEFCLLVALSNDTLRSKIGLWFKSF